MRFRKWLEAATTEKDKISTTSGNGGDFIDNNDDDGDDDDDFENGPWGWKKMESLKLQLHDWAKTSPATQQIGQIFTKHLFEQKPTKEYCRVFPSHVQVETEWVFDMQSWSNFDDEIEAVLKKSDLYKPLGIRKEDLWNVVDKGAVYDYVLYVMIMALTSRAYNQNPSLPQTRANINSYVIRTITTPFTLPDPDDYEMGDDDTAALLESGIQSMLNWLQTKSLQPHLFKGLPAAKKLRSVLVALLHNEDKSVEAEEVRK